MLSSFCSPLNSISPIQGTISAVTTGIISVLGIISVVIRGHFGGGDHFDDGDYFGGGTELHALHTVFFGTSASSSGNALSRSSYLHSATSSNPAHKTVARCLRWYSMSSNSSSLPCREWTPCSIDKDNAGCYQYGTSIVGASIIARQQGVAIWRLGEHQGSHACYENESHAILGVNLPW